MNVSRSAVLVHNRDVFSFRTRVKRASVAGMWSAQLQMFFFFVLLAGTVVLGARPL